MRSNVYFFADWQAEDALARLTEQRWQEVRRERLEAERLARRQRERKIHWITNVVLISVMCAACFVAGLVVGVL